MVSQIGQRAAFLAVCSLGLACWWPFFRNSYLGMVFYGDVSSLSNGVFLGIVALGVGLFSIACLIPPWTKRRADFAVGCLACCAAFLALVLFRVDGAFASVVLALCVSLAGAAASLGWFLVLCRISWFDAAAVLSVSFFLSFCLPYVAHFYGEAAMLLLNDALMPISAVCLGVVLALFRFDEMYTNIEDCERPQFASSTKEMILVLILFLVVGGIFRGWFGQGSLEYSPAAEGEFRYAIALVLSGVLIAFTLAFSRQSVFFVVVWAVLAFAFFAGLVLLSALALPADEIWSSVVITARTFMALLLWMVAVRFCRARGLRTQVRCATVLLLGVETACLLLTAIVSPFVNEALGECNPSIVSCVMAIVLVAWSFVYLVVLVVRGPLEAGRQKSENAPSFPSEDCVVDPSSVPGKVCGERGEEEQACAPGVFEIANFDSAAQEAVDCRREACRMLAEKHDITEREEDVLYQLSLGHSVKKVADTLFISSGTVKSHVKRIYRKLDCHSRQEVIDLVDEEMRA